MLGPVLLRACCLRNNTLEITAEAKWALGGSAREMRMIETTARALLHQASLQPGIPSSWRRYCRTPGQGPAKDPPVLRPSFEYLDGGRCRSFDDVLRRGIDYRDFQRRQTHRRLQQFMNGLEFHVIRHIVRPSGRWKIFLLYWIRIPLWPYSHK